MGVSALFRAYPAVNDGLKANAMSKLIGACMRLVATVVLKRKQAQFELKDHKLIQSCKTRWNSIYDMFERLLEQRWAVTAVVSDRTVTKLADAQTLELTDEKWQTLESMLPVQASLKRATTVTSGETYVSESMV